MKDLSIVRIDKEKSFLEERVDMNEVELWGAMAMLCNALNSNPYSDEVFTLSEIDGDTYYANKYLEVNGDGYITHDSDGKMICISSLFIKKGNMLFGIAFECDEDRLESKEDEPSFIVRID